MTQTIAIVNEKGGTGKTTTAVNLSAALGELGKKVLLVDLDGQAASSRWLGIEDDTRFADALWSGEPFEPIPEVIPGVALAPGSGKLDSVAHDLRPTQGGQLRKILGQLPGFDYVIIDCPPSLGNRLIGNALLAATHAIVPVEASILALDGLRILLTTFQDVRDGFGHDIVLRGVLTCRYDARTRLSRLVLAELNRSLPGRVFRTVIRENIRMRECPGSGKSILAYAPDCHAAEDYRALGKELLEARAVPSADVTAGGADMETELSEEERRAIFDLRGQVNALFRAQEAPGASVAQPYRQARPADLAATDQPSPQPEPALEKFLSPPAQVPSASVIVSEQPDQVPAAAPLEQAEGNERWARGLSRGGEEVGPVGEGAGEHSESEPEPPQRPAETPPTQEAAPEQAPAPPAPEAGDPAGEPPSPKDELEALRAVLRKLSPKSEPDDGPQEDRRLPSWRRFFTKRSA